MNPNQQPPQPQQPINPPPSTPNQSPQPQQPWQQPNQPSTPQPQSTPSQTPYVNPGPVQPKKSRVGIIVLILTVLTLLIVGAVLAWVLLSSKGGNSAEEKAVKSFFQAARDKDCSGVINGMSDRNLRGMERDMAIERCESSPTIMDSLAGTASEGEISSTKLLASEDNKAEVEVSAKTEDGNEKGTIELVFEDGAWRIDNVRSR